MTRRSATSPLSWAGPTTAWASARKPATTRNWCADPAADVALPDPTLLRSGQVGKRKRQRLRVRAGPAGAVRLSAAPAGRVRVRREDVLVQRLDRQPAAPADRQQEQQAADPAAER